MRALKSPLRLPFAAACLALACGLLSACGSGVDPHLQRPLAALRHERPADQRQARPRIPGLCRAGVGSAAISGDAQRPIRGAWDRRVQISGQYRLAGGEGFRRRLRLHQGDRGRRRRGREIPRNWDGAKAAGVPRGAYHFVYWCRPPHEEIAQFRERRADRARTRCRQCSTWRRRQPPGPASARSTARKCSRTCARCSRRWSVTTARSRSYTHPWTSIRRFCIRTRCPNIRSGCARPNTIRTVRYGSRKWTFWQYRSDGNVPGIPGAVDQNTFHGTQEQWEKWVREQTRG